jgi:hypothetical protein
MEYGEAIIFDHLDSVEMDQSQPVIYDREIGCGCSMRIRTRGLSTI